MPVNNLIVLLCFIAWIFLLIPSVIYLCRAWKVKFDNLKGVFGEDALKLYFEQFYPSEDISSEKNLAKKFEKSFYQNYGRRHYIIPLILLALVAGIGMIFVANNVFYWLSLDSAFKHLPAIAISSFLGAYMWVAFDQIQRFRMLNFTSHDVYGCCYRFLIAVPIGFAFSATVVDSVGAPLSFFLGAFPAKPLFTFGRRFVTQRLGIGEERGEEKSELEQLQCINRGEAEKYQDEGITNILQLAYSNPVDLTLRTNFDFNYIIDCISQALLWLYVGKNIDRLYPLGLRGAQEVVVLYSNLNSENPQKKQMAENNLKEAAKFLAIDENSLKQTLFNVTEDPYTQFIWNVWC